MTTKELLKRLEEKDVFVFVWAIMWRMWLLAIAFGFTVGVLSSFFESL